MGLKIEPASTEELESEFGTSTSGNDPETVSYIRGLAVGQGFNVSADAGETDRMVKRRINACAKEAFRELDWRVRPSGGLAARVKAVDVDAEKAWTAEQEAAQKASQESQQSPPTNESPNGTPPEGETPPEGSESRGRKREPAGVA